MNKIFALAVFFALLAPFAAAQDVEIGVYVLNLGRFDVATGMFTADIYIDMQCSEDCSTVDYEFMNGRATSVDRIIDTENEKFHRVQASLASPVDLRRFPFDSQRMQIVIEDKRNDITQTLFIPNNELSGIDESIVFTGWNLDGWTAEAVEHNYDIYDETYSQYVFSIDISRIPFNSFLKTFLPVIFIVLVMLSSYVIDPDKVATRLAMAGSALVASVMFHVSITNQIPPVGYLTFADKFMLLTYAVVLGSFIINILLLEFQELKKEKIVQKIHKNTEYSAFVIVPLLYIVLFVFFM